MKIRGWKLNYRSKVATNWIGTNHDGMVDVWHTGKKGVLTLAYVRTLGWVLDTYKGVRGVVYDTRERAEKDAIKYMKAHPRG